ncbi:unnamed protein product [Schistosoma mattheei]|uniref:Uncharacterized protein n=1 Tax=Schistosoma mattheei TaxID=31246 RepID=A0A183PKB4_9TREM|nr:unnamed protein product [Schistosoma mattheei]
MVVGGSRQETLDPGFVLLGTRQLGDTGSNPPGSTSSLKITACRCHPIGSIVRHDCDRRSGQCRCKQGVAGLTCDRCQDGYHQTRSPLNPCTKGKK